jgi:nitrate/nitrite transporter NarK
LWRNRVFSCICINVFCIWAGFNAVEQYLNFYFQNVQNVSPLGTALRFLPAPISGALTNVVVGMTVGRVKGNYIVILTTIPCIVGSVLMVIANPAWSYWTCAFMAGLLNPIGADGIYTVSNLLISSMFPPKTQGVAGGVFNTISQTGKGVGLGLTALVANGITANYPSSNKSSPEALLKGYRAAFAFCAALFAASLLLSIWGLRKIGKVGRKMD